MVNRWLFAMLVVTTTALMGSSFAVGKIGLAYVSPLLLVGIRFTLAGSLMAFAVRKRRHPKEKFDWIRMMMVGFFQTAGVMGCIFLSLRTISAGESSILTFTNPLLVVVFGTIFFGAKYRLVQWGGVLLGFLGVFITMGFHLHFRIGTVLGLLSAVSWASATLLVTKWGARFDTWTLTAYQMFFGGIALLVGSVTLERPYLVINITSVTIILWLAVLASIVQFAIWFYLLHHGDPGKTSAFLFLAPFFGVLSGWVLLGESVKWPVFGGGILIVVGIFLVNWRPVGVTR